MRYDDLLVAVEVDDARRCVAERLPGLRSRTADERVEYRTNAGLLVATLAPATLPSGEPGTRLRYRTAIVGSHHVHARTQARAVRRALEDCER